MIRVNRGDIFLVQHHDLDGGGKQIDSTACIASIRPATSSSPEHVVLTAINLDGSLGQSSCYFPPEYVGGAIPIVRIVGKSKPQAVESVSKISGTN